MRSMFFSCLMLSACIVVTAARAEPVTFSDTVFNPAHWKATSGVTQSPFVIASSVSTSVIVSGTTIDQSPALAISVGHGRGWSRVAVVNNQFSYDPAVTGAISSLDFDITQQFRDVYDLPWRLLVVQGGRYYGSRDQFRALSSGQSMTYIRYLGADLDARNFGEQVDDWFNEESHPDFAASGAPMYFGFLMESLTGIPSGYTWRSYYGSYALAIETGYAPVPEINPAGFGPVVAILSGALGLVERLRKRRSAGHDRRARR